MLVKKSLHMSRCIVLAAITAMCVMLFGQSTQAADLKVLVDRLERLERDIRTLNIQISRGHNALGAKVPISAGTIQSSSNAGMSRLTMRLDNLEQDIRTATGSLEELGHGIREITDRLDRLVSDVDFRLSSFEEKLTNSSVNVLGRQMNKGDRVYSTNLGSKGTNDPVSSEVPLVTAPSKAKSFLGTVSSKAVETIGKKSISAGTNSVSASPSKGQEKKRLPTLLPAGKPKEQYTFALNLLRQTKYDQAELALTQFIAKHAEHPLAGNARYWLGETYYVRTDYEQAAQTFFSSYRVSPTNAKAPDMLLKLGMSLLQLKKTKEACATFDKLKQDFPDASKRINSAIARERKRAHC